VQGGIIIHDETSEDKEIHSQASSTGAFSFEDKLKPHSESALTFGAGLKGIPLPTFIEAQE